MGYPPPSSMGYLSPNTMGYPSPSATGHLFPYAMGYQSLDTSRESQLKPIYLYTTPLRSQREFFKQKKPVSVFAHWAVCIQDRCYELTRNDYRKNKKTDPKYLEKYTHEQEWIQKKKDEGRECETQLAGYTSFSAVKVEYWAYRVWETLLGSKYVYDEQDCQVFIYLLVDLIGDSETRAKFP